MTETSLPPARVYFDFSTIFKATKSYIDQHNKSNTQLTKRLNANHRATAELMVRLYAKQLNRAIALGEDLRKGLPGFKTFNTSLATCKGCTKRTIMNHKERLKAAGFITKEIHRGKAGIELWLNPLILSTKKISTSPFDNALSKSEKTIDLDGKTKKLHPLVHVPQEQNNNNSSVDKLITSKNYNRLTAYEMEDNMTKIPRLEHRKNTRKSSIFNSNEQKNKVNPAQNLSPETAKVNSSTRKSSTPKPKSHNKCNKNTSIGVAESAFLLKLVTDFWNYAKAILYKDVVLSAPEESDILNNIWISVYNKFKIKGTLNDWTLYQELLYNRIDMVANYLERDPRRWVAPCHLYFDPKNKRNGFDKTYQWFLKQQLLKKTIRNQILVQTTEKEWKEYDKGKGRHKHKTRLQLFRIHEQRLGTYSDEQLMRDYENSLKRHLIRSKVS